MIALASGSGIDVDGDEREIPLARQLEQPVAVLDALDDEAVDHARC